MASKRNPKNKNRRIRPSELERYERLIRSVAARYAPILFSREELESLAWEGAMRGYYSFDEERGTKLTSWMCFKANGAIKDALRKEKKRREHETQYSKTILDAYVYDADTEESDSADQKKELVANALSKLDGRTKEIIRRCFFNGETQAKISATLGISQSWCSRLYRRGMEQLKLELSRAVNG